MVTDYQKRWRDWIESPEGNDCAKFSNLSGERYLQNRLQLAFNGGWNSRDALITLNRKPPKYESMTIAIDDGKGLGYQAFHEAIQDSWEPLFYWADEFGTHVALRRLET